MHILQVELCQQKTVTGNTQFCLIEAVKILFENTAIYFCEKLIVQRDGLGVGFHLHHQKLKYTFFIPYQIRPTIESANVHTISIAPRVACSYKIAQLQNNAVKSLI